MQWVLQTRQQPEGQHTQKFSVATLVVALRREQYLIRATFLNDNVITSGDVQIDSAGITTNTKPS